MPISRIYARKAKSTDSRHPWNRCLVANLGREDAVDPWSDQLQMAKWPEGAMSEAGKLSFEVTPFIFYLTRQNDKSATQTTGGVAMKLDTSKNPK